MSDNPEANVPFSEAIKQSPGQPTTAESDMRGAFHNTRTQLGETAGHTNPVVAERANFMSERWGVAPEYAQELAELMALQPPASELFSWNPEEIKAAMAQMISEQSAGENNNPFTFRQSLLKTVGGMLARAGWRMPPGEQQK